MMKRFFTLSALSLLALACSRTTTEQEFEQPDPVSSYLTAYIDNDFDATKTAYVIDEQQKKAIFSWAQGDAVDAVVKVGDSYTGVRFVSESAGVSARFVDGQVPGEPTFVSLLAEDPTASRAPWAFYPSRLDMDAQVAGFAIDWDVRKNYYAADKSKYPDEDYLVTVTLPSRITPPNGNPLSVVPMLGRLDGNDEYVFTPMTGVLAIPVTGITMEMDYVTLSSETAALSGSFHVPTATGSITQKSAVNAGHSLTLSIAGVEGDATFYFPVAAGTIPAGLQLTVGDSEDTDNMMVVTTKAPITIQTGHIARSPAIAFTPVDQKWQKLTDGRFLDDFIWGQHSAFTADTWVNVEIERSGLHPNKYRIANPYPDACELFGYEPYTAGIEADDYLIFTVDEETGLVRFNRMRLGLEDKDSGGRPMMITHPLDWSSSKKGTYNKVISSLKDGTPAEIELAAIFSDPNDSGYMYSRDGEGHSSPNRIHILFSAEDEDDDSQWEVVYDVQYKDDFIFNNRLKYPADTYVSVTLEVNTEMEGQYRLVNPYPELAAELGYKIPEYVGEADDYLYLTIGKDKSVYFKPLHAGINLDDKDLTITHPKDVSGKNPNNNYVGAFQSDGMPNYIQLAPIYHETDNLAYLYSRDNNDNIIRIIFPESQEPETWSEVAEGLFIDNKLWGLHGWGDETIFVNLEQCDSDPSKFRIENPYLAAAEHFAYEPYTDGITESASEYLEFSIQSGNAVRFATMLAGIEDKNSGGKPMKVWYPLDWGSTWTAQAAYCKVNSYRKDGLPEDIQLYAIYSDPVTVSYKYTNNPLISITFYEEQEYWTNAGTASFLDTFIWGRSNNFTAGTYVEVPIRKSQDTPGRYSIANPYLAAADHFGYTVPEALQGAPADEWLKFSVAENGLVEFDSFDTGINLDASKALTITHPTEWATYGGKSGSAQDNKVTLYGDGGAPYVIQLAPIFHETGNYKEATTSAGGYYYPPNGSRLVYIRMPGAGDLGEAVVVEHVQYPLMKNQDNPVLKLTMPDGKLESLKVKITGIEPSKVTGFYTMAGGSYMNNADAPVDEEGVANISGLSNPDFSGAVTVYVKFADGAPAIGSSIRFEVLSAIVSGQSLPILQESDIAHHPGIVLNHAGDKISVRGDSTEVCASFRIPALVTARDGSLIAAYDVRYDSSTDLQADIDVGYKRSTDGGKTWSSLGLAMDMGIWGYEKEVSGGSMSSKQAEQQNGIGDPCLLVDDNTGDLYCFAVWTHGHAGARSLSYASTGYDPNDTPQFMLVKSTDNGLTWSDPVNITTQAKRPEWMMTFQGPGRGITMADGTLVIPNQHQEGSRSLNSGIMYSTDHGRSWHTHNYACTNTSEACVVEISPGVLLLSMRDESNSRARRAYVTSDLGRSWTEHVSNGQMIEPTCEASMLKIAAADNVTGKELILFSNPNSTSGRNHIAIQVSTDKAVSWPYKLMLDEGSSMGYSCLTQIDDKTVGIVYESSKGNILFQAIPIQDIVK